MVRLTGSRVGEDGIEHGGKIASRAVNLFPQAGEKNSSSHRDVARILCRLIWATSLREPGPTQTKSFASRIRCIPVCRHVREWEGGTRFPERLTLELTVG